MPSRWIAWQLADVLLLAFGAVLVAVLLHAFADVLVRFARVPERWALTTATIVILLLVVGIFALFGAQIRLQISGIAERLPFALNNFTKELGLGEVTAQLPQMLGMGAGGGFVSRLAGIGGTILGGLADFLLVVIAGIYIAASPRTYRKGLVKLFPRGPARPHRGVARRRRGGAEALARRAAHRHDGRRRAQRRSPSG